MGGKRERVTQEQRARERERTALNTHSSTRPTGTLFPCKFCLLSLPFPPLSVSSSSSFTRTLSRESEATHVCISGLHHAHLPPFHSPSVGNLWLIYIILHFVQILSPSCTLSTLPKRTVRELFADDPRQCNLLTLLHTLAAVCLSEILLFSARKEIRPSAI